LFPVFFFTFGDEKNKQGGGKHRGLFFHHLLKQMMKKKTPNTGWDKIPPPKNSPIISKSIPLNIKIESFFNGFSMYPKNTKLGIIKI